MIPRRFLSSGEAALTPNIMERCPFLSLSNPSLGFDTDAKWQEGDRQRKFNNLAN
jgi:hypothetical protein